MRLSPIRWLAWLGDLYSTVIRGIPDLVLILLIFYGGQDLLNRVAPMLGYDDYIDLNPLAAGIGTLGFIFGAYLSETFRGAFMAHRRRPFAPDRTTAGPCQQDQAPGW